jgi:hypothetical protein
MSTRRVFNPGYIGLVLAAGLFFAGCKGIGPGAEEPGTEQPGTEQPGLGVEGVQVYANDETAYTGADIGTFSSLYRLGMNGPAIPGGVTGGKLTVSFPGSFSGHFVPPGYFDNSQSPAGLRLVVLAINEVSLNKGMYYGNRLWMVYANMNGTLSDGVTTLTFPQGWSLWDLSGTVFTRMEDCYAAGYRWYKRDDSGGRYYDEITDEPGVRKFPFTTRTDEGGTVYLIINLHGRGDGQGGMIPDAYTLRPQGAGTFPVGTWDSSTIGETLEFTGTTVILSSRYDMSTYQYYRYDYTISGTNSAGVLRLTNQAYIPSPEEEDLVANWPAGEAAFRAARPWIPSTSDITPVIDASGINYQIVDYPDMTFVDDPAVKGKWKTYDFVGEIDDFVPGAPGEIWDRGLDFKDNGVLEARFETSWYPQPQDGWTRGILKTGTDASEYEVKTLSGTPYLFIQHKSGDYSMRGMKPMYYVYVKDDDV